MNFLEQPCTGGPPSSTKTVEAWKFAGGNSKGFSPINVPNQLVDCLEYGIRPVCGLATVGQETKLKGLPVAARPTEFLYFDLKK